MANALMATGLALPQINTMDSFAKGVNARQMTDDNQLTLARKSMENIGAIALGSMGGKLDGQVNPEQFEQGLDLLAQSGLNVDAFRGKPGIAPIAARASMSALQQLQTAQNQQEIDLAMKKFAFDIQQAAKGKPNSFSQTPVFLLDEEGKQHAAQMSSGGGMLIDGKVMHSLPPGWRVVARPENLDNINLGGQMGTFDPNTGSYGGGPVIQGSPSANMDVSAGPDGTRVMTPAAGSPEALERLAADEAKRAKQEQTERYGNVVVEDIDRVVQLIEADPLLTTGLIGQWTKDLGGSPAMRVSKLIDTIKANAGFDRLQAMRDSSPTGGALGAINKEEMNLLQSAIGSLEQSGNADDLVYNLRRVQQIYNDIIHGPGNAPAQTGGGGAPAGGDVVDWADYF